jgi:hypothetical protein
MTGRREAYCDRLRNSARIAKGAIKQARAMGLKVGLFRPVTLWPFRGISLKIIGHHEIFPGL